MLAEVAPIPAPRVVFVCHRLPSFFDPPPPPLQGNVYRLHKRKPSSSTITPEATQAATTTDRGGGAGALDPRGGRLPNVSAEGHASSSLGLGISYVSFRARRGTAAGIARFYRELFGAEAEEMGGGGSGDGGVGGGGSGEDVCSVTREGDSGKLSSCSTVRGFMFFRTF